MADQTQRKGTQVVHVRENSDHELEAMFKAAYNPSDSQSIPFRLRNLPPSFFTPPEPQKQVHSREGSTDSTGYTNPPPHSVHSSVGPNSVIHGRTRSSPANLQSSQLTTLPPPQHSRQRSCDLLLEEQPLPPGWEMAKTPQGQMYFLNHLTQKTTWQDPRKANFDANSAIPMGHPGGAGGQGTPPQLSPNVSMQNVAGGIQGMMMPQGWEQAMTPEGEVYYINHVDRSTSWFDPRLPLHMQRLNVRSPNQPAPGVQQSPVHSQPIQQGPPPAAVGMASPGAPGAPQNQTALQKLQEERELLRKRQEELARQELQLRTTQQNHVSTMDSTSAEMTTITDPFLGQNTSSDLHTRQGSTDSGLGGMGSGSSFLSKTPDEFLGNVSEIDVQDAGQRGPGDFNNVDMASMDTTEHTNMDSDDLVPSLQAEDINNELLNDVENVINSNKIDSLLTWL